MDNKKKLEVLRRYFIGSNIGAIMRDLKLEEGEVLDVLLENPTTAHEVAQHLRDHLDGKFVSFMYKAKLGRDKLPEHKKRKIRQVRISDDEMSQLGNPNSTEIRRRLFRLKKIEELVQRLDAAGITVIPNEWMERDYPSSDPFWRPIHNDAFYRLQSLAEYERAISYVIETYGTDKKDE